MIAKTFSQQGALGKAIPGFQARQAQIDMAEAVANAIKQSSQLVVEAGTGTGKTFAYLVPALLSGKKVIISTGSKNLQEQLFHRDLPLMVGALGFHGNVALLKGRANYLCLDRLSRQMVESHTNEADPTLLTQLVKVRSWASETKTGDLGECDDLPEDSLVIPTITSTNDNCLGKECPSYQDCFVSKARRKAMDADVVVVNHHLFLADLAIKETGFGELIPEADVFIFDEAHQLPDIASQYFGQSVSSRQIQELAKDIEIGYRTEAKDMRQLQKVGDKLVQSAMDLRIVLGSRGIAETGAKRCNRHRFRARLNACWIASILPSRCSSWRWGAANCSTPLLNEPILLKGALSACAMCRSPVIPTGMTPRRAISACTSRRSPWRINSMNRWK